MSNREFYQSNYDVLVSYVMTANAGKIILGSRPKICRICDRGENRTTFKSCAHVVPEFVGNKCLFSNYECDNCNAYFGTLEHDLGNMSNANRVFGNVRKKKGSPKYKNLIGTFEMQHFGNVLDIKYLEDGNETLKRDSSNDSIELKLPTSEFRPLAIYKSLAKFSYMLMPPELLPDFSNLKAWLQSKELNAGRQYGIYGHGCFVSGIPGYSPTVPTVKLLVRTQDIDAPFCIIILVFGHFVFQAIVPCPKWDYRLLNRQVSFRTVPITYDFPTTDHQPVEPTWLDLSSPEKVVQVQTWVAISHANI